MLAGMAEPHLLRHLTAAAALFLMFIPAARPAVYRCDDATITFSQFPCPGGARITLAPAQSVEIPPLTDAERQRLEELERDRQNQRTARQRSAARSAASARQTRQQRRERCETARREQQNLRRERRKGYSLAEARALDRRQAQLDEALRHNC